MNHSPEMEVSKITDNIYLGTGMCCEEHVSYHWERLKELDIYCDIDLRLEHNEVPDGMPVHLKLPIADTFPNTLEQTKIGVEVMDQVVNMGKNVYVHCQYGVGRSPTMVIAYFMLKKGMSFDEAFDLVKSKRSQTDPTDKQVEFLKSL